MRGAEVPEDILSEEQCTKEPMQSGNAPEGEARIISAPTANQTSPGHATGALKCQGITASFLCCINGIQSTPNFSRDQCKGLSRCDICPITSPARHPRRAARGAGGWGRIPARHFPTFPLHICYQEMREKVPSRATKTESRKICLTFASFEQPETAADFSIPKSTKSTTWRRLWFFCW